MRWRCSIQPEFNFRNIARLDGLMRVDLRPVRELDPAAVIRPLAGEWHPRMPERLDENELADWRAGRNAVYQLAAPTLAPASRVADA